MADLASSDEREDKFKGQPLAVVFTPDEWNALEPDVQRDLRYRLAPYEEHEFKARFRRYLPPGMLRDPRPWMNIEYKTRGSVEMGRDEDY